MVKKVVLWDIENISYQSFKKYAKNFDEFSKRIVHNYQFISLRENQQNYLKHLKWKFILVKPGKDSADFEIIKFIENNFRKYNEFHLISSDKGFSSTIIMLLRLKKKVTIYCHENKTNKFLKYVYNSLTPKELLNFHVQFI